MVKIPAGFLYPGIRDNSFSVELLRKYHRLEMQFSEWAGPGPAPIDIDLDTLMEIINIESREVRLPAFDIDAHEVTNAEYRKFLDAAAKDRTISHPDEPADKDRTPRSWSKAVSGKFTLDKPNQPVTGIDFFDAYAFAQWSGKRLPTEDEWEAAVRGSDGRRYSWGNHFDEKLYVANNGDGKGPKAITNLRTTGPDRPVGMEANVSEWTSTQSAPTSGRITMITKGGSWLTMTGEIYGLAFIRNTASRLQWGIDTGFRCAKDARGDKPPKGMIRIPANKYHLGGDDSPLMEIYRKLSVNYRLSVEVFINYDQEELPVHAFLIDKYEVTNGQYNQFLSYIKATGDQKFAHPDQPADKDHAPKFYKDNNFNGSDQPVVGVDWYDAYAFAKWAGKRLPTADEWERAARGDTDWLYPWGNEFSPDRDVFGESPQRAPAAVAVDSGGASPFGVWHMAGNIEEWTSSIVKGKKREPVQRLRGGNWRESGKVKGLTFIRFVQAEREYRGNEVGFRCAANSR